MQKPTVGRIVYYYPSTNDYLHSYGRPLAALICWVWSDTCVNLSVFDDTGMPRSRTSVLLHQDGERPSAHFAEFPQHAAQPVAASLQVVLDPSSGTPLQPIDDEQIEAELRTSPAVKAPRVTLDQIDALHASLVVFTHHFPGTTTTVAIATLPNGFVAGTGRSSCVSPANFDAKIGERIATQNALDVARENLWEMEGYRLRTTLDGAKDVLTTQEAGNANP
ncbi:MAG TPA: Gp49 family protein [Burkholderiaceae bacterium]